MCSAQAYTPAKVVEWFHHIIAHGGLHNGLQRSADSYRAPRSTARQGKGSIGGSTTVALTGHRELHCVAALQRIVTQTATGIIASGTRLVHQHPTVFTHAEKTWEGVTLPIS